MAEARITRNRNFLPGKAYLPKMNPAMSEVAMTMSVDPTDTTTLFRK
jgi:hypothetical protein